MLKVIGFLCLLFFFPGLGSSASLLPPAALSARARQLRVQRVWPRARVLCSSSSNCLASEERSLGITTRNLGSNRCMKWNRGNSFGSTLPLHSNDALRSASALIPSAPAHTRDKFVYLSGDADVVPSSQWSRELHPPLPMLQPDIEMDMDLFSASVDLPWLWREARSPGTWRRLSDIALSAVLAGIEWSGLSRLHVLGLGLGFDPPMTMAARRGGECAAAMAKQLVNNSSSIKLFDDLAAAVRCAHRESRFLAVYVEDGRLPATGPDAGAEAQGLVRGALAAEDVLGILSGDFVLFAGSTGSPATRRVLDALQLPTGDAQAQQRGGGAAAGSFPLLAVLHCPGEGAVEVVANMTLSATIPPSNSSIGTVTQKQVAHDRVVAHNVISSQLRVFLTKVIERNYWRLQNIQRSLRSRN